MTVCIYYARVTRFSVLILNGRIFYFTMQFQKYISKGEKGQTVIKERKRGVRDDKKKNLFPPNFNQTFPTVSHTFTI